MLLRATEFLKINVLLCIFQTPTYNDTSATVSVESLCEILSNLQLTLSFSFPELLLCSCQYPRCQIIHKDLSVLSSSKSIWLHFYCSGASYSKLTMVLVKQTLTFQTYYSRTSVARTLMARLPRLFRTRS